MRMKDDQNVSVSCPVMGFDISDIEDPASWTLINYLNLDVNNSQMFNLISLKLQ